MITLYGRKPVLEILLDPETSIFRLHLAESNQRGDTITQIRKIAQKRGIDIITHPKGALSRISKNARQDQGVAIDIAPPKYQSVEQVSDNAGQLLALDGITNPQNLGMIVRSVAASPMNGLLLPKKGCAKIDPLVHKASAGTLIKSSIYHCPTIESGLKSLRSKGYQLIGLSGGVDRSLGDIGNANGKIVFVLGNETTGISEPVLALCDELACIPLESGVESINVAMAATLVAFRTTFSGT
ncbi:MAG: RNA methyltransferase [Gammaproteobacteria bacterium]|nr:RNA methyltransferase [Gammaproteobacteria bacterium]MBT6586412.1 RNA methyltransferase [Gammaproteobacteria bacterium]